MKDFKLTRNEQPARCHVCGIKSKDVFSLAEDGQKERMLCSVCLSLEHPEKMKLETQTGLLLKRNTNRKLYSLLFRSIAKAEKSTDDSYREKAQKLKQILLSTTDLVLNETGSDDGYDLLHLIKKHHQLLPMNFDDEFVTSVAESDELPDVSDWNEIYKGKRGFK
ncbi:TPA: hypothetical protein RRX16_004649 [Klebsiella pneumoniae]|nr:hypothetical protein [Salmonella enterica subsp. enterica serovar Newport]HDZ1577667.1 hypothetical protein [Klebsiella pneumoniae]